MPLRTNVCIYDLEAFFKFFYFYFPLVFYLLPTLYTFFFGDVNMYFFGAYNISFSDFIKISIGYFIIGIFVLNLIKVVGFRLELKPCNTLVLNFFILFLFLLYLFWPSGYLKLVLNAGFILSLSRYRPGHLLFLLMLIASLIKLVFFYDRFPVIIVLIFWVLPFLSNLSIKKLFFLSLLGMFFLVYILQPLRSGHFPFSTGLFDSSFYFVKHMFPMYIAAYVSLDYKFSILQLLSEMTPMLRGVLGYTSAIDLVAQEVLTSVEYQSGTRLGSNSSMYFNLYGFSILFFAYIWVKYSLRFFTGTWYRNAFLILLIFQAPYFVRRSIGSLFMDYLILFLISTVILLFIQVYRGRSFKD